MKMTVLVACGLAACGLHAGGCGARREGADTGAPVVAPLPVPEVATAPPPVPLPDDLEPSPAKVGDGPDAGTVRIKLVAEARRQAHVYWGRKDLGVAPLEIVRPRGSAPMDLTVQAPDCLPLHTRVFTDRDDTLSLRLYTEREASGLPGYSAPPAIPSGPTKTRR
jgi:hypothetical protein